MIAISAAQRHSLALLADGTVIGWGTDHVGESSGDGIGHQSGCECVDRPAKVQGTPPAMSVGAGTSDGKALLANGAVLAWGFAGRGGLGNGLTEGVGECSCLPTGATLVSGVTAISQGGHQGLALRPDGSVLSWGANDAGQLGNGTTDDEEGSCYCDPVPAPIPSLSGVRAFTTSQYASLILRGDGTVAAFGLGKGGEIGNGSTSDATTPTTVPNVSGASAVGGVGGTFFALIGPSQSLDVALSGAGSGTVGAAGLLCPPQCNQRFSQGKVEVLRAEPSPGSGFAGFSGACSGTGVCRVKLGADTSVGATFGPAAGTADHPGEDRPHEEEGRIRLQRPRGDHRLRVQVDPAEAKKVHRKKVHAQSARLAKKGKKAKRKPPQFASCASVQTYKHLKPGGYRFEVRALDILGADAHPATMKFKLKKPHRHRRRRAARRAPAESPATAESSGSFVARGAGAQQGPLDGGDGRAAKAAASLGAMPSSRACSDRGFPGGEGGGGDGGQGRVLGASQGGGGDGAADQLGVLGGPAAEEIGEETRGCSRGRSRRATSRSRRGCGRHRGSGASAASWALPPGKWW